MEKETKKENKKVYPKYNGRALSEKQIKIVEALESRGIDAFAKGRFKILKQAIIVAGLKCYPYREGKNAKKKNVVFDADIIEVLNFEAYGIGVENEPPIDQDSYLERVTDATPLRSRVKIAKTKTKKSRK